MRWLALPLLCLGCGLAAPREGKLVSDGVGRAVFETRNAGTDLIPVTVLFPATQSGSLRGSQLPAVVFVQGGFVASSRYEWQAIELARAGYVVALAENELQLAFFSVDAGEAARRLLAAPPPGSLLEGAVNPERIAVAGHSLGSIVALKLALNGRFNALVLQAGFPDPADLSSLAKFTRPSMSLAGELDCSAKLEGVQSGWQSMPSSTALVVLSGVTHFQFTVAQDDDEKRGCPPTASLDDAHARISAAMRVFLDAAGADGSVGEAALRQIPGATVEVR